MSGSVTRGIAHLTQHDAVLAAYINTTTSRPSFESHTNYYHALVTSIISQQLSVKAAATITDRFLALFESSFPTPTDILACSPETLSGVGLSRPKVRYIQDLALHIIEGTVTFDDIAARTNDEIIQELTQVKGIGVWTVHMFLMFCMGRLDVLPIGDLGIRNGIQALYGLGHQPTPEDITALAAIHNWHPYESIASWFVWRSLDNTPAIKS